MASSASSSSSSSRIIKLQSYDGQVFQVREPVISLSKTVKHLVGEDADSTVQLPNVTGAVMSKVLEYCEKYEEESRRRSSDYASRMEIWDGEFVKEFKDDQDMLFGVLLASDFLQIEGLTTLICKSIAGMMTGKSSEEIREIFHMKNDFTEEEQEEIRRENEWASKNEIPRRK